MRPVPLIRGTVLRILIEHVDGSRAPRPRLPGETLVRRDPEALLPASAGGRAFELAALELGRPELGLRVGEATALERLPAGEILRSSRTLGSALDALVRDGSRYTTGLRYRLVRRREVAWLHFALAPQVTHGRRQLGDMVLAFLVRLVRRAAGPGWRPDEIRCEGPPPPHEAALAALARKRISFGHRDTGMSIRGPLLLLPMPEPTAAAFPPERGDPPATDPLASVRQTIEALVALGEPTIAAAAEAAGLSPRTLQRHLHQAGLRFGDLVQQVRLHAAARMLAEPHARVIDVSAALGYSDSANFTRAFRRWTGVAPLRFQRAVRGVAIGRATA